MRCSPESISSTDRPVCRAACIAPRSTVLCHRVWPVMASTIRAARRQLIGVESMTCRADVEPGKIVGVTGVPSIGTSSSHGCSRYIASVASAHARIAGRQPSALEDGLRRGPDRLLLHEQHQVVFGGHVAVQRHRAEAERRRDAGHRDGSQSAGIRELDGHLDDALDAHLALGAALRVRRDAPGQGDAAGQLRFGHPSARRPSSISLLDRLTITVYDLSSNVYAINSLWHIAQFMLANKERIMTDIDRRPRASANRSATTEVLRDLDLTVERGTVFALLGPNGAGKTTIINILSTLVAPGQRHRDRRGIRRRAPSASRSSAGSASPASRRPSTRCSPARRTCG